MNTLTSTAKDEALRLSELSRYSILISEPEGVYDDLARIASLALKTPFGGVSLVDDQTVWLKGKVGVDINCLAREGAFCSYAVESNRDLFVVNDATADSRFVDNPLVTNAPNVRLYAAATLASPRGYRLGTLWVMDDKPRDLTESEKITLSALAGQASHLLELKYRNPITSLPNGSAFVTRVQRVLNGDDAGNDEIDDVADKWRPLEGVVGYIHVNNIHQINSAYGREIGDRALTAFASSLRRWMGRNGFLAHVDADSFSFFLQHDPKTVRRMMDELSTLIGHSFEIDYMSIRYSCAIGVSRFPESGFSASSLLDQAAAAAVGVMHDLASPNVRTFDQSQSDKTFQTMQGHAMLPLALKEKRISPFYQPLIDIENDGDVIGFEALARIVDPKLGQISPQYFIPLAEETGIISDVDLQIIEAVCRDLRSWMDHGVAIAPIAINLSRITLKQVDIVSRIRSILATFQISPHLLEFEVTESGIADAEEGIYERVHELHACGFKISVDDFGTGLSNLSVLKSFNFHRLKADRIYVHESSKSEHAGGLMRFIHNISELFGVELICEGVETEDDLRWLKSLGCRYFQGWYFCRTMNADNVENLMRKLQTLRSDPKRNLGGLVTLLREAN